jgi:hypothetical protein
VKTSESPGAGCAAGFQFPAVIQSVPEPPAQVSGFACACCTIKPPRAADTERASIDRVFAEIARLPTPGEADCHARDDFLLKDAARRELTDCISQTLRTVNDADKDTTNLVVTGLQTTRVTSSTSRRLHCQREIMARPEQALQKKEDSGSISR